MDIKGVEEYNVFLCDNLYKHNWLTKINGQQAFCNFWEVGWFAF
jgi:hypothetical protein